GEVRPDPAGGQVADLLHPVGSETARDPLVRDARVAKAVADDVLAVRPRRADHLADELGPGSAEEEQLRERIELERGILDQLADPLAGGGASRLAHQDGSIAQRLREQLCLGGLAGASMPSRETNTSPG